MTVAARERAAAPLLPQAVRTVWKRLEPRTVPSRPASASAKRWGGGAAAQLCTHALCQSGSACLPGRERKSDLPASQQLRPLLSVLCCGCAPADMLLQEQREQLEQQYEATAADLEREQQLNASMRLSATVLDALKISKDCAVNVLEAAADRPALENQQQKQQVGD